MFKVYNFMKVKYNTQIYLNATCYSLSLQDAARLLCKIATGKYFIPSHYKHRFHFKGQEINFSHCSPWKSQYEMGPFSVNDRRTFFFIPHVRLGTRSRLSETSI